LVDIGHLQQLAPDGIEAGPAQRSSGQTPDMCRVDMQNAPDDRKAPDEPDLASGRSDDDHRDRMIDILDLDAYLRRCPVHTRSRE